MKISFKEKNKNLVTILNENQNKECFLIYLEILINRYGKHFKSYEKIKNGNFNLNNVLFELNLNENENKKDKKHKILKSNKLNIRNDLKLKKECISILKNYIVRFNKGFDKTNNDIFNFVIIGFNLFNDIDKFLIIDFMNKYYFLDNFKHKDILNFLNDFNKLFFNDNPKIKKFILSLNFANF